MKMGVDYIGVGVGAIVLNAQGAVFLSQRGTHATNERGCWEFPGGKVGFGEAMREALRREFLEEYGMVIAVMDLLSVDDHILPEEGQHWISPTFLAKHLSGEPRILEPDKCSDIGWFQMDALPAPLSKITILNVEAYRAKYG